MALLLSVCQSSLQNDDYSSGIFHFISTVFSNACLIMFSLVAGDVTSVLRDTTNLEQVREEAKERRKRRKKKRSGSTLVASVFSGKCNEFC